MSILSKFGKKVERSLSNIIPHTHSAERRAQMQAASQQIQAYQDLKSQFAEQRKQTENQQRQEREKIQQKQIRKFRRTRRAPGFLDQVSEEMKDTLG